MRDLSGPHFRLLTITLILIATIGVVGKAVAQTGSVFLMESVEPRTDFVPRSKCNPMSPRHQSFDLAVVDFRDDGSLGEPKQLADALACIQTAGNVNPLLQLVLFVHGWRHDSSWSDANFVEFRRLLQRLALREVEGSAGRRIFGVFVGWPGGNITDLFNPSYDRAQRIGDGLQFRKMLWDLVDTTRKSAKGSTIVFAGHSLGAAMLEAGYANLLTDIVSAPAAGLPVAVNPCKSIVGVQRPELLPDLVLLLGTASEASLTESVIAKLRGKISKRITCGANFDAPLVAYVASRTDRTTGFAFWVRRGLGRTAGNTDALITHEFARDGRTGYSCPARPSYEDFGQSWHCLRAPPDITAPATTMIVDLPRIQDPRDPCHERYVARASPSFTGTTQSPFWIIRVPDDIVSGHNDIFNARSTLMAMALLQMSGATVGIWQNYSAMFEPERGGCVFR
jgi:hypothetical protein